MSKINIYQVLVRHFGNKEKNRTCNGSIDENGCGKMNDFTPKVLREIKKMGFSHIWYTGLLEHATQTDYSAFGISKDHPAVVKGKAGSPYAVKDYYDIDPDLAVDVSQRMNEFGNLIDRTHKSGLKVLIDFIPNHVARQYRSDAKPENVVDLGENDNPEWAFSPLNNFYYCPGQEFNPQFDKKDYSENPAKATGNDQFTASPGINDWYETVKLNYGVNYVEGGQKQFDPLPDTWTKMYDILHFWASKKVDGFRCDMAEMVPVEFWHWVIARLKTDFPQLIFIAEVYNPAEYRNYIHHGGFDYLYDKVGLYDKLRAILTQNHAASDITQCWQSLNDIRDQMLNFLENHDEQRIASSFFCGSASVAFPAMVVSATISKAPVMIYSGQELGEPGMDNEGFSGCDGRTSIFDYWSVDSVQRWYNNGYFGSKHLSLSEKNTRDFYVKLLNICATEKAISDGVFYDLEYFNQNKDGFNAHKHYTYIRKADDECLLFVVNFDSYGCDIKIRIPSEAFKYLNIEEKTSVEMIDLLSDKPAPHTTCISSENEIPISLKAYSSAILKFVVS